MTDIQARTVGEHTFIVGDAVRLGRGAIVWRITEFFGPNYSYAALERTDVPSSRSSAHLGRLTAVKP